MKGTVVILKKKKASLCPLERNRGRSNEKEGKEMEIGHLRDGGKKKERVKEREGRRQMEGGGVGRLVTAGPWNSCSLIY